MSPRFKGYDIDHFYVLDQVGDRVDIVLQGMNWRLGKQIDRFRPDIVVVHMGMAYNMERKQYLQVINQLMQAHPSVRFVADKYIPDEEGFEGIRLGDDPEIDQFILELEGL